MCVHSTQVDGNVIKAVGYVKFTNVQTLYDLVIGQLADDEFTQVFRTTANKYLRWRVEKEESSNQKKEYQQALIESGRDLLVYAKMEIVLTVDDLTKKIIHMKLDTKLTSMHEAVYIPEEGNSKSS
jgi:hypothetical protein